jgi:hypothetical protein
MIQSSLPGPLPAHRDKPSCRFSPLPTERKAGQPSANSGHTPVCCPEKQKIRFGSRIIRFVLDVQQPWRDDSLLLGEAAAPFVIQNAFLPRPDAANCQQI